MVWKVLVVGVHYKPRVWKHKYKVCCESQGCTVYQQNSFAEPAMLVERSATLGRILNTHISEGGVGRRSMRVRPRCVVGGGRRVMLREMTLWRSTRVRILCMANSVCRVGGARSCAYQQKHATYRPLVMASDWRTSRC